MKVFVVHIFQFYISLTIHFRVSVVAGIIIHLRVISVFKLFHIIVIHCLHLGFHVLLWGKFIFYEIFLFELGELFLASTGWAVMCPLFLNCFRVTAAPWWSNSDQGCDGSRKAELFYKLSLLALCFLLLWGIIGLVWGGLLNQWYFQHFLEWVVGCAVFKDRYIQLWVFLFQGFR